MFVFQLRAQNYNTNKISVVEISEKVFDSLFNEYKQKNQFVNQYDTSSHNFSIKCDSEKIFIFKDSIYIENIPEVSFLMLNKTPKNIKVVYESRLPTEHSSTLLINTNTCKINRIRGSIEFNDSLTLFYVIDDICTDCDINPIELWDVKNDTFTLLYKEEKNEESILNFASTAFWISSTTFALQTFQNTHKLITIKKL